MIKSKSRTGHFAMTLLIEQFNFTVVSSIFSAIFLSVTQDGIVSKPQFLSIPETTLVAK
jgi:hypothetical protein